MSLFVVSTLLMGTLIFSLSWVLSRRKKVIDQLESDVRIFLALVLIASFYFRFSTVSVIYFITLFREFELEYVVTSLYFLFPVVLGFSLYLLTPRLCERILHPKSIPVPDSIIKISTLLGLSNIPRVCTTSLEIPPFVYGRRKNSSTLVLPQHMESFLTEEEQEAVIAHELSHIKQGDTGIITWLTFLLEGIKYWILPIPIFIYFGMTSLFFGTERSLVPGVLILLFYVAVFLLKNSLSRIRESISDAYVVFNGYEDALKRALYKYAAFKTDYRGSALALCFHRGIKYHPVLATHPPLTERLETIDKKRFIIEPMKNLSVELAFWVGLVSAFLSFNGMFGIGSLIIMGEMVFSTPSSDIALDLMWLIPSIAAMGVVGISYLFPSTKGLVLFSDLGDSTFLLPLVRNWGITILTAAIIIYGLTVFMPFVRILVPFMCVGFFVWFVGFSASRFPHIGEKMWALPALPFFPS
jgi:Zn-dependent protease with chaperone function